jgi:hypothetical protein
LTEVYHTPLTTATQGGTFIIVSPGRSSQHAARQAACVFFFFYYFFSGYAEEGWKTSEDLPGSEIIFSLAFPSNL